MSVIRVLKRGFGTFSQKELARAEGLLNSIRKSEGQLSAVGANELRGRGKALRERVAAGGSVEEVMVEALAVAAEMAYRSIGLRPFDVQLLGAICLHRGNIAEMKTGEGKTLVVALAAVLGALAGKGTHVVTVNDYLAARDADWMRPIYDAFGLTVGLITEKMDPEKDRKARRKAYCADITYVTNHELVFDYLRDNLARTKDEIVGRELHFALVDEADFLLLDEARTPLIISGPSAGNPALIKKSNTIVQRMKETAHFEVDHKTRQASFLDAGYDLAEKALGIRNLADAEHEGWRHALHSALLAHAVYEKDVDYIVAKDQVVLIDEHTGRLSPDKRYASGLHQALEAKEKVEVRAEDITFAKISYQNYFRLYPRLSGTTGTAFSEREEFSDIYGLGVVKVPTNRPVIRRDTEDVVYRTDKEKTAAAVRAIIVERAKGRPVLVGTASVRDTEKISGLLDKKKIPHEVLNAKNHQREAKIIARAGRAGAVTVATNMAGRGTDIVLGGGDEEEGRQVRASGGLAVIGTELYESVRIDEQLRGRAGRQGDPGTSAFLMSLEDPIFKKFGKKVIPELARRLAKHPKQEPVSDRSVIKTLRTLRDKVEIENRAIRKEVFKYDLVIDEQRRHLYRWRRDLLEAGSEALEQSLRDLAEGEEKAVTTLLKRSEKVSRPRAIAAVLSSIDDIWIEHLNQLEEMDEGIGLSAYAERDPLVEFRRQASLLFKDLQDRIRSTVLERLLSDGASKGKPRSPGPTKSDTRRRTRKG